MGTLFIDIEKAFDKVWINVLLYKLDKLGIPNYLGAWIRNYLTDRSFLVKCGEAYSRERSFQTGVPQGSVLGPAVLFIIFFNNITQSSVPSCKMSLALFADDVAFWTT